HQGSAYLQAVEESPFNRALRDDRIDWHWGEADWISDPPTKADPGHATNQEPILARHLMRHVRSAELDLLLSSAYGIAGCRGEGFLSSRAEPGVDVRVLAASLASSAGLAVHSAYASSRRPLLEGGFRPWGLRRQAGDQERASAFAGESLASLH